MNSNTGQVCTAYQEGYNNGYANQHLNNVYSNITELAEAWYIGDIAGRKKRQEEIVKYYFVSYRVIKESGGIFYNYIAIQGEPSAWVISKLAKGIRDHYHITYAESISQQDYEMCISIFSIGGDT